MKPWLLRIPATLCLVLLLAGQTSTALTGLVQAASPPDDAATRLQSMVMLVLEQGQ